MPGVPLLFGLPVDEAKRAADDGRLFLGGCFLPDGEVSNRECEQRHRWRDGTDEDQRAEILQILAAYGYEDGARDH